MSSLSSESPSWICRHMAGDAIARITDSFLLSVDRLCDSAIYLLLQTLCVSLNFYESPVNIMLALAEHCVQIFLYNVLCKLL